MLVLCLNVLCLYTTSILGNLGRSEEDIGFPGTRVTVVSCHIEKQQVLLSAEPTLQPVLWFRLFSISDFSFLLPFKINFTIIAFLSSTLPCPRLANGGSSGMFLVDRVWLANGGSSGTFLVGIV